MKEKPVRRLREWSYHEHPFPHLCGLSCSDNPRGIEGLKIRTSKIVSDWTMGPGARVETMNTFYVLEGPGKMDGSGPCYL